MILLLVHSSEPASTLLPFPPPLLPHLNSICLALCFSGLTARPDISILSPWVLWFSSSTGLAISDCNFIFNFICVYALAKFMIQKYLVICGFAKVSRLLSKSLKISKSTWRGYDRCAAYYWWKISLGWQEGLLTPNGCVLHPKAMRCHLSIYNRKAAGTDLFFGTLTLVAMEGGVWKVQRQLLPRTEEWREPRKKPLLWRWIPWNLPSPLWLCQLSLAHSQLVLLVKRPWKTYYWWGGSEYKFRLWSQNATFQPYNLVCVNCLTTLSLSFLICKNRNNQFLPPDIIMSIKFSSYETCRKCLTCW